MSYEKDRLDSFVTSASLSTALAPYVTSASVASAIAGINLAPYVTSNSLSAAVATDVLTVRGAASVSATLSAGAVTVAGRPVGAVVLGYQAINNVTSFSFSGSWSDIAYIEIRASYKMSGSGSTSIAVFTDGGTTAFLSGSTAVGDVDAVHFLGQVWGVNGVLSKKIYGSWERASNGSGIGASTFTATTGFINCIRITHHRTVSGGAALAIGYRTT
jgi:hypothetical protein